MGGMWLIQLWARTENRYGRSEELESKSNRRSFDFAALRSATVCSCQQFFETEASAHEFFEAWAIFPPDVVFGRERFSGLFPALIGSDESQPVIPRRVGLHQSPSPLGRLLSVCITAMWPAEPCGPVGDLPVFV
jgi:hypothetical protein